MRSAANGLQALEEVRRWEFDLIVTDLKMDKMDGMQLLEEARKLSPSTQVMMVTGFATVDTAVQAMRQGAVYYLAKPVNLDELRSTVAQLAKGKAAPTVFRSPVLCFSGPPGNGQDFGRSGHRPGPGPQVSPHVSGRPARRGRAARPPAHLCGRSARPVLQSINRLGVRNPVFHAR